MQSRNDSGLLLPVTAAVLLAFAPPLAAGWLGLEGAAEVILRFLIPAALSLLLTVGLYGRECLDPRPGPAMKGLLLTLPSAALAGINLLTGGGWRPSCAWVLFALGAAIFEESLYRVLLVSALRTRWENAAGPVAASALLFSLAHLPNLGELGLGGTLFQMGYTLALGLLYGYAFYRTRSPFGGMLFHFLINVTAR